MRLIDAKIDALKGDEINMDKFTRPVTAFISMENEEGLNRLL